MERDKIIFYRNLFFRAFVIGVAFVLFYFVITYTFWNTWASLVTSWFKVDEKDLARFALLFLGYMRLVVLFFLPGASAGFALDGQAELMSDLLIRIKKKADGSAALSCVRPDGSTTWQRQEGAQGRFFPIHDLTHYVVETVLGHRRGFYGLVADGWDLTDFGAPWPKGKLPADLDPSELIVGFLDAERASGVESSADEFNKNAVNYYAQHGLSGSCRVTDEQLKRIRGMLRELIAQWNVLPAGEILELSFQR